MKLLTEGILIQVEPQPLSLLDIGPSLLMFEKRFGAKPTAIHANAETISITLNVAGTIYGIEIIEDDDVPVGHVWIPYMEDNDASQKTSPGRTPEPEMHDNLE